MPQGSGGKDGVIWSCLGEGIKDAILSRELDEARLDCKDDWLLLLARKIIMLDKTMHTRKVCSHFLESKLEVINYFLNPPHRAILKDRNPHREGTKSIGFKMIGIPD